MERCRATLFSDSFDTISLLGGAYLKILYTGSFSTVKMPDLLHRQLCLFYQNLFVCIPFNIFFLKEFVSSNTVWYT